MIFQNLFLMSPEIQQIFFHPQFNLIVGYRIHNLKKSISRFKNKLYLKIGPLRLRPPTFEFAVNIVT